MYRAIGGTIEVGPVEGCLIARDLGRVEAVLEDLVMMKLLRSRESVRGQEVNMRKLSVEKVNC